MMKSIVVLLFLAMLANVATAQEQLARRIVSAGSLQPSNSHAIPVSQNISAKTEADTTIFIDWVEAERFPKTIGSATAGRTFFFGPATIHSDSANPFMGPAYEAGNEMVAMMLNPVVDQSLGVPFITGDSVIVPMTASYRVNRISFTYSHVNVTGLEDTIRVMLVKNQVNFGQGPANYPTGFIYPDFDYMFTPGSVVWDTLIIRDLGVSSNRFDEAGLTMQPLFDYIDVDQAGLSVFVGYSGPTIDTFAVWGGSFIKYDVATTGPGGTWDVYMTGGQPEQDSTEVAYNPTSWSAFWSQGGSRSVSMNADLTYTSTGLPYVYQHWDMSAQVILRDSVPPDTTPTVSTPEFGGTAFVGQVRPNPTAQGHSILLPFHLSRGQEVGVRVRNVLGQEVFARQYGSINAGDYRFQIPTESFNPGLYFVTFESQGVVKTQRVVVQ